MLQSGANVTTTLPSFIHFLHQHLSQSPYNPTSFPFFFKTSTLHYFHFSIMFFIYNSSHAGTKGELKAISDETMLLKHGYQGFINKVVLGGGQIQVYWEMYCSMNLRHCTLLFYYVIPF